jgi:ArsR family transcriptional regulator
VELEANPETTVDIVRVLAALSDVNRFRIVVLLTPEDADLSCGAICSALGLSASLVSHHLSVLEHAGIIDRRRNGLWTLNRLRRDELARRLSSLRPIMQPSANGILTD